MPSKALALINAGGQILPDLRLLERSKERPKDFTRDPKVGFIGVLSMILNLARRTSPPPIGRLTAPFLVDKPGTTGCLFPHFHGLSLFRLVTSFPSFARLYPRGRMRTRLQSMDRLQWICLGHDRVRSLHQAIYGQANCVTSGQLSTSKQSTAFSYSKDPVRPYKIPTIGYTP